MLFPFRCPSDAVAMYTESGSWSYGRLSGASERIADAIGGRSLIFLLCTNTPASIAGYVACMNHGIVPAMVDGELDCGHFLDIKVRLPWKGAAPGHSRKADTGQRSAA